MESRAVRGEKGKKREEVDQLTSSVSLAGHSRAVH